MDLEATPVIVEQICTSSLRLVRQAALKKNLDLQLALDPQATRMWTDLRRLKQILVNLLSNAVKFTPEGGSVGLQVCGDEAQGVIRFTVWDTGVGIAPEQLSRLFQPFVQLDSGLARKYAGTGLGLALVQGMVELQRGSVAVESELGSGSRFTVTLPWRPVESASLGKVADQPVNVPAKRVPAEPQASAGALPTILQVEDNEGNGELVVDYLTSVGYDVVWARSGAEALELAPKVQPALILMDIQMPDMDGLEATRRFRAEPALSSVPIIALTGLAMPGDRERCLRAGASDYMTKPVSLVALRTTIAEWLRGRKEASA
jgi:CheY-like chemotaxis protein